MKLTFYSELFLRTAAKSFADFDYNNLEAVLKTNEFQAAIYFASESLFEEVKKAQFNYQNLDKKVQYSLQKYYNRYCFRCTPFGTFAAIGIASWSKFTDHQVIAGKGKISVTPDFQMLQKIGIVLENNYSQKLRYFKNETIYKSGSKYRYYKFYNKGEVEGQFKIYSFDFSRFLAGLFKFCEPGKLISELVMFCTQKGVDIKEAELFVSDLIATEILLSEVINSHVGESYFSVLNGVIERLENEGASKRNWRRFYNMVIEPNSAEKFPLQKFSLLKWPLVYDQRKNLFYVINSVKFNGGIPSVYQDQISEAISCLDKLNPYDQLSSLKFFKEKFRRRYQDQEVPLLLALDPEQGLQYGGAEKEYADDLILNGLTFNNSEVENTIKWRAVHQLLLGKICNNDRYQPIVINEEDLEGLKSEKELFPPSYSVIFTVGNESICIENAGGCSAVTLPARFTVVDESVRDYASKIMEIEQQVNHEVVFAEVSCLINDRSANINQRRASYDYQIPILLTHLSNTARLIKLEDLYLSLHNNEIVLRSRKLNKRVIPRISNAYNFSRHDLALFRFLGDLQFQSIKCDLNLNIQKLLPGLCFYPRVVYRSCIISKAVWILGKTEINQLLKTQEIKADLTVFFAEFNIPKLFHLVDHDNSLLFDQSNETSMELFLHLIRNQSSVTLQEALNTFNSPIKNSSGKSLLTEMVACIINDQPVYRNIVYPPAPPSSKQPRRSYFPGEEWVYIKIYSVSHILEDIIGKELYKCISQLDKLEALSQWFFIRYNDPDVHLRIRLKIKNGDMGLVLSVFHTALKKRLADGNIFNFQIDTYERELERYGFKNILAVERIFDSSSRMIISYFHNNAFNSFKVSQLEAALVSVDEIINQVEKEFSNKIIFINEVVQRFGDEFKMNKELKIQLDEKYRKNRKIIFTCLASDKRSVIIDQLGFNGLYSGLKELLSNSELENYFTKKKILADIIHLHINRLVAEEPRQQEFVIYYLLYKYCRSLSNINDLSVSI